MGYLEEATSRWLFYPTDPKNDEVTQIEMRVCVNDNILWFSDYPNYRATNFKKPRNISKYPINTTLKYKFFVAMGEDKSLEKCVLVESVQMVDKFPS